MAKKLKISAKKVPGYLLLEFMIAIAITGFVFVSIMKFPAHILRLTRVFQSRLRQDILATKALSLLEQDLRSIYYLPKVTGASKPSAKVEGAGQVDKKNSGLDVNTPVPCAMEIKNQGGQVTHLAFLTSNNLDAAWNHNAPRIVKVVYTLLANNNAVEVLPIVTDKVVPVLYSLYRQQVDELGLDAKKEPKQPDKVEPGMQLVCDQIQEFKIQAFFIPFPEKDKDSEVEKGKAGDANVAVLPEAQAVDAVAMQMVDGVWPPPNKDAEATNAPYWLSCKLVLYNAGAPFVQTKLMVLDTAFQNHKPTQKGRPIGD